MPVVTGAHTALGATLAISALVIATFVWMYLANGKTSPPPRSTGSSVAAEAPKDESTPRHREEPPARTPAKPTAKSIDQEPRQQHTPTSALSPALREAAARWLPAHRQEDLGLVGAAKVLSELEDDAQAAQWTRGADATFDQLLQEMGLDRSDPELVQQLQVADAPFARALADTQRTIVRTAMALSIEIVESGKAIEVRPEDFPLRHATPSRVAELAKKQERMLEEACPEFTGKPDDLTYVSIGGATPGIGRIIPLNRRDHHTYFAARDDLVRYQEQRRSAWRAVLDGRHSRR